MLHGVIETAHRVIVWAYSVIVGAHSIFLRAHFSMWRYTKSLCSMNKHYCDVHKESSWGFTKPFWCHTRSIWGSRRAILMVKQNHCEGHTKSMWGHTNFLGGTQKLCEDTVIVMAYICDVAYSHLRSNRNVLNVTICHCEYHTESLLRSYGIIMNVPQPLWGHRSYGEGIQNHSKSHRESSGWHIEILC